LVSLKIQIELALNFISRVVWSLRKLINRVVHMILKL